MAVYTSTGVPGRIGDIHIDVIENIRAPRSYPRTNVSLERGAPITNHRQREPFQITVQILISDAPPAIGPWESQHASKTRDRLFALQARGTEVVFFDGRDIWRTPTGSRVWVIDDIDDGKSPETHSSLTVQAWRATITLGEVSRFSTSFTVIDPSLDPSITDATDGIVDKGQQSTETIPADQAAQIPG